MTFRLLGLPEELRLAIEQASGNDTEQARLIYEAAVNEAEQRVTHQVNQSLREVQSVIGPHGSITRLQAGGIRVSNGEGVGVYLDGVFKTNIQPNGTLVIGSDISRPENTTEIFFVEDTVYNGEELGAGDFLVGDNSQGNLKWDASEGQLQFREGTTINVYMDTDGALKAGGGNIILGQGGIDIIDNGTTGNGYISFYDASGTTMQGRIINTEGNLAFTTFQIGDGFLFFPKLSTATSIPVQIKENPDFTDSLQLNVGIAPSGSTVSLGSEVVIWAGADGKETVFNNGGRDIDFRVEGASVSNVFKVNAGEDRTEFGADHYIPTRNSSNPNVYFNEAGEDMDFIVKDDAGTVALKVDAGAHEVQVYGVAVGGSGALVQEKSTQTGAVDSTTAAIPGDDTIPQNTEGKEIFTVSITPTSATNKLRIDVMFFGASSLVDIITVARFQDTTANALAAGFMYAPVNGHIGTIAFTHTMDAGTTSATTFKVRMGTHGGSTLTLNGSGGARKLGGVLASSVVVREVVP